MKTTDNVMITEVADGMISNDPANKIATKEIIFKYLEQAYPELETKDDTYIL